MMMIGWHFGSERALSYFSSPASLESTAERLAPSFPIASAQTYSSTTPERIIEQLTIPEAIPRHGKFIVADLSGMDLLLYQDGTEKAEFPILTKGRPGSFFETPTGFYSVLSKSKNHFNAGEGVYMPYSMQFYGNYFIHGWPYYPGDKPVASTYSGGCIRLSTDDAAKVYAFADQGTPVFVYDASTTRVTEPLSIGNVPGPSISAAAYLIADVDTGTVYLEHDAETPRPIASLTKLMTALVANETIMFYKNIEVTKGDLDHSPAAADALGETFTVGDLFYPLLMESNNAIADDLARYYGTNGFVAWMDSTARSLDMSESRFADASGVSPQDVSTPDDLFRLARYEIDHKSFIFRISKTPIKSLTSRQGDKFVFNNFNLFSGDPDFIGGKVGKTGQAGETMLSLFSVPGQEATHRVAIIILDSKNYRTDTQKLHDWITSAAASAQSSAACASCSVKQYRTIDP
ncbi:MAG: L,D-transpeptidase family protein [Patescibacteria group bacterium]|nr:L,D-transpeptidase family protein [Patescibacteria group bacterium]